MMKKYMRHLFSLLMALCMISACCISPAMAADDDTSCSEDMVLVPAGQFGTPDASTYGFGGPAPYVTNIELIYQGPIPGGNYGIRLKVTGYGRDWAYLDGVAIKSEEIDYFINYGTTADGFIYQYDFGFYPEPGSVHKFTVTFRSVRDSNKTMTFTKNFSF